MEGSYTGKCVKDVALSHEPQQVVFKCRCWGATWHVCSWMSCRFIQRRSFVYLMPCSGVPHLVCAGTRARSRGLSLPGQVPELPPPGGPRAPTWLNSSSTSCSLSSRALRFWKQHERALTSELRSGWIKPSILTETFRPGPDSPDTETRFCT